MNRILTIFSVFIGIASMYSFQIPTISGGETPLPCINKKFTIVAHVVLDSAGNAGVTETMIRDDVAMVNQYFEPICVSFEVCEFNYIENYQYDSYAPIGDAENLEILFKYHKRDRINLFFVFEDDDMPTRCGDGTVGGVNMRYGYIYVVKRCMGTINMVHQMGHYFGLENTYEGNDELVDGSNCETNGDRICDTPADPFNPNGDDEFTKGCRYTSTIQDANGEYYNPDVGNIMSDYGTCRCDFTDGQYRKMAETYLNSVQTNW